MSGVVGDGFNADGLEHDHGAAALNDAEEDVAGFGSLKGDFETELIAVVGEGGGNVPDDETGSDGGDLCHGRGVVSSRNGVKCEGVSVGLTST